MTTEQLLLIGIGGLITAVVFLFKIFDSHYRDLVKKNNECEVDRRALWQKISEIESRPHLPG